MKPICIDLFCGLGGWSEGFLAEGYECIGFDIERHDYGNGGYPGQLVLQDVTMIHGSQFRNAAVIVASPPCQRYSFMAMPFNRGKRQAAEIRGNICGECHGVGYLDYGAGMGSCNTCHGTGQDAHRLWKLNELFDACFRIQREAIDATKEYCHVCAGTGQCNACEGTGVCYSHIPLVVENVRGAQPWVGRSRYNYGSFHLWGDVPALMPSAQTLRMKSRIGCAPSRDCGVEAQKQPIWFNDDKRRRNGDKCGGDWFGAGADMSLMRSMSSKSSARKAASAQIAKIPFELSRWIASVYKPEFTKKMEVA